MTGVEAVSNGVMAFGEPRTKNAQRTSKEQIAIVLTSSEGREASNASHRTVYKVRSIRFALTITLLKKATSSSTW